MTTVALAINKLTHEVEVFQFVEDARDAVFTWVKKALMAENQPEEQMTVEDWMEENFDTINETVIQAEETPWLCPYEIIEKVIKKKS